MILYMICRLVCVTVSWAHMSIVHSILSLKLGVTLYKPSAPGLNVECPNPLNGSRFG